MPIEINKKFMGENLKELRVKAGMQQADLAKKLNRSQSSVAQMENRKNVRLITVIDYLDHIGYKIVIVKK